MEVTYGLVLIETDASWCRRPRINSRHSVANDVQRIVLSSPAARTRRDAVGRLVVQFTRRFGTLSCVVRDQSCVSINRLCLSHWWSGRCYVAFQVVGNNIRPRPNPVC